MNSRRAHRKSRLGCRTCKQRRVKCDEQRPTCGPCRNKSIKCEYANNYLAKKRPPPTPEPVNQSSTTVDWSWSKRSLELELLHQWATVTYKSYCTTIEEEYYNWQVSVPKLALKHECLLHGIFAMSALEIALFSGNSVSQEYISHALHYQNLASSELREELSSVDLTQITQDKHQALWALSSILMALALAVPPVTAQGTEDYSMLDHIMTYTELSRGLVIIVHSKVNSIKDDPLLCNYKEWEELESHPIEAGTRQALDRLMELNEETYGASRTERQTTELQAMTYHAACRKAIFFLDETFSKCSQPHTRSYGLAFTLLAGKDFLSALKNKEQVALLILLHWGVFLEKQSYGVWYAERVGKYLVEDLTDSVRSTDNEKLNDGLSWVREQVGLPSEP